MAPPDRTVKVLISLPEQLLARVDDDAEQRGLSRSAYVRDALRHRLVARPDLARRQHASDALRRAFRDVEMETSPEELIRTERDR